jgi:hypothetical protein
MSQQQEKENLKTDLINDLISVTVVMEEIWKYHPSNPNKIDIITEYENLEKIKQLIELDLDRLEE